MNQKQKYVIALRKDGEEKFLSYFLIRKPELGIRYNNYETGIDFDLSRSFLMALRFSKKRLAYHVAKCVQDFVRDDVSFFIVDMKEEKATFVGKGGWHPKEDDE